MHGQLLDSMSILQGEQRILSDTTIEALKTLFREEGSFIQVRNSYTVLYLRPHCEARAIC